MKYLGVLEDSWSKLLKDCYSGRFTPLEEADIQSYLYYLCLKKINNPSKIHVEWLVKGKYIDIMFGKNQLAVEIKWSSVTKSNCLSKTKIKRWTTDIVKLSRFFRKKSVMIIFFALKRGIDDYSPIRKHYLPRKQQNAIEIFVKKAKRYGVKVLPLYLN